MSRRSAISKSRCGSISAAASIDAGRNASRSVAQPRHCSGVPTVGDAKQLSIARCCAAARSHQRRDAPVRRAQLAGSCGAIQERRQQPAR